MTSSNGNIFRVTGPLCGEFTGHRWIIFTQASDAELWCFLWSAGQPVEQTVEKPVILDGHYDVTVLNWIRSPSLWCYICQANAYLARHEVLSVSPSNPNILLTIPFPIDQFIRFKSYLKMIAGKYLYETLCSVAPFTKRDFLVMRHG